MSRFKRVPAAFIVDAGKNKTVLKELTELELEMCGASSLVSAAPDNLDDLAKEYYDFLYEEMKNIGLLSNLDIPLMAQLADAFSKIEQADEYIKEQGLLVFTGDRAGVPQYKEHPAIAIKLKYLAQARPMMMLLGLSPTSRASLAEVKMKKAKQEEDPLIKLLAGIED